MSKHLINWLWFECETNFKQLSRNSFRKASYTRPLSLNLRIPKISLPILQRKKEVGIAWPANTTYCVGFICEEWREGGEGYVFHRWEGWATSLANFVCFFIQILWKLQFGKSTRLQPGVGATVLYLSWGSGLCLCRSPVCRSLCRAASHNP